MAPLPAATAGPRGRSLPEGRRKDGERSELTPWSGFAENEAKGHKGASGRNPPTTLPQKHAPFGGLKSRNMGHMRGGDHSRPPRRCSPRYMALRHEPFMGQMADGFPGHFLISSFSFVWLSISEPPSIYMTPWCVWKVEGWVIYVWGGEGEGWVCSHPTSATEGGGAPGRAPGQGSSSGAKGGSRSAQHEGFWFRKFGLGQP